MFPRKFNVLFRKKQKQCCMLIQCKLYFVYIIVFNCNCLNYQNYWHFLFYIFRIPAFRVKEHFTGCLPDFYICLALSKTDSANIYLSNRIKIKDLLAYQNDSLSISYNFLIHKLPVRYLNLYY